MILADTSKWIEHLRTNTVLTDYLDTRRVLSHPFVRGELALGMIKNRDAILHDMTLMPQAVVARDNEVMHFIRQLRLSGSGIGYVDAHLLAATQLTSGAMLWTSDKRLQRTAQLLNLAFVP
jgi:predicted nucleic acid-binding protein